MGKPHSLKLKSECQSLYIHVMDICSSVYQLGWDLTHSFSWLKNIPLYGFATIYSNIYIYIYLLSKFHHYKSFGSVSLSVWKNIFEWEIPRNRSRVKDCVLWNVLDNCLPWRFYQFEFLLWEDKSTVFPEICQPVFSPMGKILLWYIFIWSYVGWINKENLFL